MSLPLSIKELPVNCSPWALVKLTRVNTPRLIRLSLSVKSADGGASSIFHSLPYMPSMTISHCCGVVNVVEKYTEPLFSVGKSSVTH